MRISAKDVYLQPNEISDINDHLKVLYDYLSMEGYDVLGVFLIGSQNYGLSDENSDIDTVAVVVPSIEDIIKGKKQTNKEIHFNGTLCKIKDIRNYMFELLKGSFNMLECLYTPFYIINPDYVDYLSSIEIISDDFVKENLSNFVRCINGIVNTAYKHIPKSAKKWKLISYIYYFKGVVELLNNGKSVPESIRIYPDEKQFIMDIKHNKKDVPIDKAVCDIVHYVQYINSVTDRLKKVDSGVTTKDKLVKIFQKILREKFKKELISP